MWGLFWMELQAQWMDYTLLFVVFQEHSILGSM